MNDDVTVSGVSLHSLTSTTMTFLAVRRAIRDWCKVHHRQPIALILHHDQSLKIAVEIHRAACHARDAIARPVGHSKLISWQVQPAGAAKRLDVNQYSERTCDNFFRIFATVPEALASADR